jgi:hypothetical protein
MTACSGGGEGIDALRRCPIGDPNLPVELEIMHLDARRDMYKTEIDAAVPLVPAAQGAFIMLLGVRATNLDGCNLQLTTSFRDLCSDAIIKIDQRPTVLEDTGDGWGVSSLGTFSALPFCPQVTTLRNLQGEPYVITVAVRDLDDRQASKSVPIMPTCSPNDARCACECDRNYVVGGGCPPSGPKQAFRPPTCVRENN